MRILLLGALTSTHSAKWANSLTELGHKVMLVSSPMNPNPNTKYDDNVSIKLLRYGGKLGYYLNVWQVKKIIREFRPDIINAHYASGFGTLCRLARAKPLVISCWGSDVYEYPFLNKFNLYILRKNLLYSDAIGCTSFAMADQVRLILDNPQQKVTVTPFGVNVNRFNIPKIKCTNERPVIGFIKYFFPIYDVPLLINAFTIFYKESLIKPILQLYGEGELQGELIELTKMLGIQDSVLFMGPIPNTDVPKALAKMDIFVNCSEKESFGVNMVEAMACGVPVVATATEGAKEVVDDGITGIVLKDRTPETMAKAFKELLSDNTKRQAMIKAGREKVLKLYDWDKNVRIMEGLYKSLILH